MAEWADAADILLNEGIETWAKEFILDRKVRGLSSRTIGFYKDDSKLLLDWCKSNEIQDVTELDPQSIRYYLTYLADGGLNRGGIHAACCTLKVFLNW